MNENPNTYGIDGMDDIDHPPHYVEGRLYEPIAVVNDWELGFNLGNAVKYIARAGRKHTGEFGLHGDALHDLRKARFYLNYHIELLEEAQAADRAAYEAVKEAEAAAQRAAERTRKPRTRR